jgi:hypothetical protein
MRKLARLAIYVAPIPVLFVIIYLQQLFPIISQSLGTIISPYASTIISVVLYVALERIFDRIFGGRPKYNQQEFFAIGKAEAERKQELEDQAKVRNEAAASLKAHYTRIIQRMEEWNYVCKGIYTKPRTVVGLEQTVAPLNLQKDLEHLKQFKQTWELYVKGFELDSDASARLQETTDLVRNYLENMIKTKTVSFVNWNMDELVKQFTIELIHAIRTGLKPQTFQPIKAAPDMARPGFLRIWAYEFEAKTSDAESFAEILNSIRQMPDVKKKIVELDAADGRVTQHISGFMHSLKDEVIEPAKNSDYTDERLSRGVCEDCRHLKGRLKTA